MKGRAIWVWVTGLLLVAVLGIWGVRIKANLIYSTSLPGSAYVITVTNDIQPEHYYAVRTTQPIEIVLLTNGLIGWRPARYWTTNAAR